MPVVTEYLHPTSYKSRSLLYKLQISLSAAPNRPSLHPLPSLLQPCRLKHCTRPGLSHASYVTQAPSSKHSPPACGTRAPHMNKRPPGEEKHAYHDPLPIPAAYNRLCPSLLHVHLPDVASLSPINQLPRQQERPWRAWKA